MSSSRIIAFPEQGRVSNNALRRLIEVFQATGLLYKTIASKVNDYNLRKLCAEQATLRVKIVAELSDFDDVNQQSKQILEEDAERLQQCYTQLEPNASSLAESQLGVNLVSAEQNCVAVLKNILAKITDIPLRKTLAGIVARMQITLDQLYKVCGKFSH